MKPEPISDWRLTDQEKHLMGAVLFFRRFRVSPSKPEWDHEHCEFCWAKIVEKDGSNDQEELTEAYATEDCYRWICPACFQDFRDHFAWTIGDTNQAEQGGAGNPAKPGA